MHIPRVRFTVRWLMVAVALAAVMMIVPDLHLWRPENTLVVMAVGATALAMEISRREVERTRSRGEKVGRFRFLGRVLLNLPIGILIVVACLEFNTLIRYKLLDVTSWILEDVLSTGLSPYDTLLGCLRILPRVYMAIDLGLVLTAFSLWDAQRQRRVGTNSRELIYDPDPPSDPSRGGD